MSDTSSSFYDLIIKILHNLIVSVRKNIFLYIICILVAIVPLLATKYTGTKNYEAKFTLAYDELVRKVYGDRLDKLNLLVQRKQYTRIANMLSVDKKAATSLTKVSGYNILGEQLSKDLNTDRLPFVVSISITDTSYTTILQDGIVRFLETGNSFMQERKKVKELENKEELVFINQQLDAMGSELQKGGATGTLVAEMSNNVSQKSKSKTNTKGISAFEYAYELYKRKQELLRKERMPSVIMVIDDAIVSVPASRPTWLLCFAGFIIGNILFVVIAGFIIPAIRYKN